MKNNLKKYNENLFQMIVFQQVRKKEENFSKIFTKTFGGYRKII
jgi:hypothetical protein